MNPSKNFKHNGQNKNQMPNFKLYFKVGEQQVSPSKFIFLSVDLGKLARMGLHLLGATALLK